ncbi:MULTISPECIES: pyrroline-5-carboxylate reductase [unclassified Zymobacter]|uniref:pyrroline-5-carboxylate reductase n=1 Tax=unclassified Zymobacter TaxID=3048685 RepID=UPI0039C0F354
MHSKTLSFIGAGHMAEAIIAGLINTGHPAERIIATARSDKTLAPLQARYGIQTTTDNCSAIAQADVVVLAVKPQVMKEVCAQVTDIVARQRPLILSVAAGLTCATLSRWLGGYDAIVRAMPNTPSLVGTGACGLYATDAVSKEQCTLASDLMSAVGITEWVDEERLLSTVTAIAGSAPAYFFYLMEALEKAAIEQGMPLESARRLIIQTALGAARMCDASEDAPEEFKKRVMSPNGTTERAIFHFQDHGFEQLVNDAVQACFNRAEELGESLGSQ